MADTSFGVTDGVELLDVRGLTVEVAVPSGRRRVVDDLHLAVRRGEIVALVGESGSGKSLTALSVLGLLPDGVSAAGSIELRGTQVVGASTTTLRSLRGIAAAMVFQEPQTALNPVQKIGRQLREALRAHALRRDQRFDRRAAQERAIALLRQVDLPDPETRIAWYPHQLSGGQKQRVAIALALTGDPGLLIADEPTTALDVTVQAEILTLLRHLRDSRGMAILLITHNLGVVADLADRVVVLRNGTVVEDAPVTRLFADPRAEYTRSLLAAVPRLPSAVAGTSADAEPRPDPPLLSLRGVSLTYPARHGNPSFEALTDVSLTLAAGEVLGLVGESGSGKTTVGRVALGLVTPSHGEVIIGGVDPRTADRRQRLELRRGLALVHQDPRASLDPRFTVGQSIAEPLLVQGSSRRTAASRVTELLDAVRLPGDFATRKPSELSGGQRQRVALARALALAPRLLVADEPTSALDVSVQAAVLELFTDLRRQYGFACLFISHDLAVVNEIAARVAVLRAGRLVEVGSVQAVFTCPTDDYTRRLVAAVPVPDPLEQRERREREESA